MVDSNLPTYVPQTASTIITVLSDIIARSPTAGSNVTSLKLRQTGVNDNALSALLEHMPLLTRLDVSFTNVRSVPQDVIPRLEKLSFTSSPASMSFLKNVIVGINLRKLTLGALGENQSLTLTDSVLTELTAAVESLEHLEDMSLVANTKLGMTSARGNGALADFITRVGRRCKVSVACSALGQQPDPNLCSATQPWRYPTPRISGPLWVDGRRAWLAG